MFTQGPTGRARVSKGLATALSGHQERQHGDRTVCFICGLSWDTNDPCPPACEPRSAAAWCSMCGSSRFEVRTAKQPNGLSRTCKVCLTCGHTWDRLAVRERPVKPKRIGLLSELVRFVRSVLQ